MTGLRLETVEVEPRAAADAAVVMMHGLGADGHDFESLVPELRLPGAPSIRWVFPHAPVRPVTINGGVRMRAWYDIVGLDRRAPEDEAGVRESSRAVLDVVRRERERGIDSSRIVLAGFSQGGAVALFTALRSPERLAGVAALSTYLPLAATLEREAHPANAAVPVFMAHGTFDPLVPPALGEGSRNLLRSRGYDVEWHEYPMPHSVCAEEAADLRAWLLRAVPPRGQREFLQERNRNRDDSDGRPDRDPLEIQDWAREHDLPCDEQGHVQFPDVRIEYDIDGRDHTLDVEVMTPHYRDAHAAAKSGSGFRL